MVSTIALVYAASCAWFLFSCLSAASSHSKLSRSARGKELKQFNRSISSDKLALAKWSLVWPWPVLRDIVDFVRWHRKNR